MLQIHSIELINVCNLACTHCPSSHSKYPTGMITLDNFEKLMKYVSKFANRYVTLSGFGESLAHPKIKEIFAIAKQYDVDLCMPTNAVLLTEDLLKHMAENKLAKLDISLHTEKSFAGYKLAYEYLSKNYPEIILTANILECYLPRLDKWMQSQSYQLTDQHKVILVNMHNWSENEREATKEESDGWQNKCIFLNSDLCVTRWDGKVYTCCIDSEGVNYVGTIDELETLKYDKSKFTLCHKCSPAWFTGEPLGSYLNF